MEGDRQGKKGRRVGVGTGRMLVDLHLRLRLAGYYIVSCIGHARGKNLGRGF